MQEFVPDSDLVESNDESLHSSRSHTWSPIAEINSHRSFPWNAQIIPPKSMVFPRRCTSFQMPPSICKNAGICKKIIVLFLMCKMQGYPQCFQSANAVLSSMCKTQGYPQRFQPANAVLSSMCETQWCFVLPIHHSDVFFIWNRSAVYAITVFFLHANRSFSKQNALLLSYIQNAGIHRTFAVTPSLWNPNVFYMKTLCSPTAFPNRSDLPYIYTIAKMLPF